MKKLMDEGEDEASSLKSQLIQSFIAMINSTTTDEYQVINREIVSFIEQNNDSIFLFIQILHDNSIRDDFDVLVCSALKHSLLTLWQNTSTEITEKHLAVADAIASLLFVPRKITRSILDVYKEYAGNLMFLQCWSNLLDECSKYVNSEESIQCKMIKALSLLSKLYEGKIVDAETMEKFLRITDAMIPYGQDITKLDRITIFKFKYALSVSIRMLTSYILGNGAYTPSPLDQQFEEKFDTQCNMLNEIFCVDISNLYLLSLLKTCAKLVYNVLKCAQHKITEKQVFYYQQWRRNIIPNIWRSISNFFQRGNPLQQMPKQRDINVLIRPLCYFCTEIIFDPVIFSWLRVFTNLTPNDINDYYQNSETFFEIAYHILDLPSFSLRNTSLTMAKELAKEMNSAQLFSVLRCLTPCESSACIVGHITKYLLQSEEYVQKSLKDWITMMYNRTINLPPNQLLEMEVAGLLFVITKSLVLFNEEEQNKFIQFCYEVIDLYQSRVINTLSISIISKLWCESFMLPNEFITFLLNFLPLSISHHPITFLLQIFKRNPEIEQFMNIDHIKCIIKLARSELSLDSRQYSIKLINASLQFLAKYVHRYGDLEISDKLMKLIVQVLTEADVDMIQYVTGLIMSCINSNSPHWLEYLKLLLQLLEDEHRFNSTLLPSIVGVFLNFLSKNSQICCDTENLSQTIFNTFLRSIIANSYSPDELFICGTLLAWLVQIDGSLNITDLVTVIFNLMNNTEEDIYRCITAFELLSSVFIHHKLQIDQPLISTWIDFLNKKIIFRLYDAKLHTQAISNVLGWYPQFTEMIQPILIQLQSSPELFISEAPNEYIDMAKLSVVNFESPIFGINI